MEETIPAVLAQLAQSGVSVRWRDGKAVFKAAAAPPADVVALIDARKAEVSAFLHPEAIRRRLDAEADVLQVPQPPDVRDDQWEAAMRGLRSFIELGYVAEALRLGWPKNELFDVPSLWSRGDLCGVGLLIGDREVIEVTPSAIRIKASSGSVLSFYRRPQPDYGVAYRAHLARSRCESGPGNEEAHLRAVEAAVNLFRSNNPDASINEARVAVVNAIKRSAAP